MVISETLPIATAFSYGDELGRSLEDVAIIDNIVTVIDAAQIADDFWSWGFLQYRQKDVSVAFLNIRSGRGVLTGSSDYLSSGAGKMSSSYVEKADLSPAIGRAPTHAESRRAISAAVVWNVLEWYDFAIYGYVATIMAKNFFADGDEIGALLATFATFGIGFVARPLGGILIGRLGDAKGRKAALLLTSKLACDRRRN